MLRAAFGESPWPPWQVAQASMLRLRRAGLGARLMAWQVVQAGGVATPAGP